MGGSHIFHSGFNKQRPEVHSNASRATQSAEPGEDSDQQDLFAPSSTDSSSATGTPVAAKKAPTSAVSRVGSSTYSSPAGAAAQPKLTASSCVHLDSRAGEQLHRCIILLLCGSGEGMLVGSLVLR